MKNHFSEELVTVNKNRQIIYSFLATVYAKEVTIEFLNDLLKKKEFFLALAENPDIQSTELARGFKNLGEYIQALEGRELKAVQVELAVDYAALFLGIQPDLPHPSESAYLSKDHFIMQQPRDNAMEMYKIIGLEKASNFLEPEDHIALELTFMAQLCEKTDAALKNSDQARLKNLLEVQRDFLNQHLDKWVPKLADDVTEHAKKDFYRAVARITKAFLKFDEKVLSELTEGAP